MDITLDADRLVTILPAGLAAASPQEFAAVIAPHMAKMAALAGRLVHGADRDDVLQEALMRAWLKRALFHPDRGTLSAWLLAITADQARKARRRRFRRTITFVSADGIQPPDERLDVELALDRLPARQRMAVDCYYFAGLSVLEAAAVMHCSEGTVKSTLADARRALRPLLEIRA